jgi:hypothetical protein
MLELMRLVAEHEDRKSFLLSVDDASQVNLDALAEQIGVGEPFVCLIWDAAGSSTDEERCAFGHKLIAAGCRYAVCGGNDGTVWDDAVDFAFVLATLDVTEAERDARFIMTTWHEGESPEEVVWFAMNCANFDDLSFDKWVVVLRGADEELRERFVTTLRAEIERKDDL